MAALPARGIETRCSPDSFRGHSRDCSRPVQESTWACETNSFHLRYSSGSHRSSANASLAKSFSHDDVSETVYQGDVCSGTQLKMIVGFDVRRSAKQDRLPVDRPRSAWRPRASAASYCEAKTGWPSVGLAPITMMTSACSTESNACVPAEVPKSCLQAIAGG